MSRSTPATTALEQADADFEIVAYAYDPRRAAKGMQAADALGVAPACVFKTLMILIDGKPACAMLAADRALSLKAAAAALGAKAAAMMPPLQAERLTGYRIGGISPFGQRRPAPAVIDLGARDQPAIFLNAGQRGLQVRIAPAEAIRVLGCAVSAIAL